MITRAMTDSPSALEERCDAYLDGDLSREEAAGFERDLAVQPELAAALSSALALRELLAALPPLAPPPGLAARIARALPLRAGKAEREREDEGSAAGAVLSGISWLYRVPAAAVMSTAGTVASAGSGLAQVRWALGPLGALPEAAPKAPPRPLWRRVIFGKGKGKGKARP